MKNLLYLFFFVISFAAFSQQKSIEITNKKTGKTIVYEENQRIKIRTLAGKKHIGNLKISDNSNFMVNNQSVKIDSLKSIKKYPKKIETTKKVLFATGLATLGASIVTAASGSESSSLLFIIGSGITIGSGIIEGINTTNSNYKWDFKIIEK